MEPGSDVALKSLVRAQVEEGGDAPHLVRGVLRPPPSRAHLQAESSTTQAASRCIPGGNPMYPRRQPYVSPRPLELTCQPTHAAAAKRQMTTPCPMRLAARPGMPCRLAQPACAASCAAGSAWLGSGLGLGLGLGFGFVLGLELGLGLGVCLGGGMPRVHGAACRAIALPGRGGPRRLGYIGLQPGIRRVAAWDT